MFLIASDMLRPPSTPEANNNNNNNKSRSSGGRLIKQFGDTIESLAAEPVQVTRVSIQLEHFFWIEVETCVFNCCQITKMAILKLSATRYRQWAEFGITGLRLFAANTNWLIPQRTGFQLSASRTRGEGKANTLFVVELCVKLRGWKKFIEQTWCLWHDLIATVCNVWAQIGATRKEKKIWKKDRR